MKVKTSLNRIKNRKENASQKMDGKKDKEKRFSENTAAGEGDSWVDAEATQDEETTCNMHHFFYNKRRTK